jgi:hypothetical protein
MSSSWCDYGTFLQQLECGYGFPVLIHVWIASARGVTMVYKHECRKFSWNMDLGMLFSWLDKVVIWIIMVKVEAPLLFSMMLSRSKVN